MGLDLQAFWLHSKLSSGLETLLTIGGKLAAVMILVSCYFWHGYSFGYWASKTEVRLEELESVSHTEWKEKSSGGRAREDIMEGLGWHGLGASK